MQKLCIIFSHASIYRESIYKQIDKAYDCEWHFSDEEGGVKRFDTNIFQNVKIHKHRRLKRFHWINGINSLLGKKENKTFLMLAGTVDLSCWLFLLRARLFCPKKKIYLWGHGWYGKETKVETFIKKLIYKSVAGIFVYGNYAKELMVKEGIPSSKIFVLHNSLDYDTQLQLRKTMTSTDVYTSHFGNNDSNLIFIGRLTEVKKLNLLVDAISYLKSNGVNVNLTFIGDGPMKESLISLVESHGLTESVWFYGACYDERINAELVYNSDLCVAPGNIGLTAIHTMMFGTPVISHDDFKWQMPEFEAIIPGETGDFFEKDSVEDLALKIKQWIEVMSDKRMNIRENCYRLVDTEWNPYFQIGVIKEHLKFADK